MNEKIAGMRIMTGKTGLWFLVLSGPRACSPRLGRPDECISAALTFWSVGVFVSFGTFWVQEGASSVAASWLVGGICFSRCPHSDWLKKFLSSLFMFLPARCFVQGARLLFWLRVGWLFGNIDCLVDRLAVWLIICWLVCNCSRFSIKNYFNISSEKLNSWLNIYHTQ